MLNNNKCDRSIIEYKKILFEKPGVLIYEEWNGNYAFELDNKVYTNDIVEAISYIIKYINMDDDFWKLPINKNNLLYVNPKNSLYWLSGGDKFWKKESNIKWSNICDDLLKKYSFKIFDSCLGNTFEDIKNNIKEKLKLDEFYDFSLKECITK